MSDTFTIKDSDKISPMQLFLLLITVVVSSADVLLPKFVAEQAMRDSWFAVVLSTIYSILVVNIIITLGLRFSDKTLAVFACEILGKPLGKIIGLLYCYFYLQIAWFVLNQLIELYNISFNNQAPKLLYALLAIIIVMYGASKGIQSIVGINVLLLPFGIGALLVIGLINLPKIELNNFLPVFYNGIYPSIKGAFTIQAWMLEVIIILQYLPYLSKQNKTRSIVNASVIAIGLSLSIGVLTFAVFGEITVKFLFPALYFVRVASLGEYLERLDLIFIGIWISGLILKIMVFYHITLVELSNVFKTKDYKSLLIPVAIIIVIMSQFGKNLNEKIHFLQYMWPFFCTTMTFVIPSILLIVSIIRNKRS